MAKPMRIALLLISLNLMSGTQCLAAEPLPSSPPLTQNQLWLSAGAGMFLGFGSGQYIQNRWSKAGWPFTIADGVGWLAVLSNFGDCLNCSRSSNDTRHTVAVIGGGLLITSRIIQVGELILFGLGDRNRGRTPVPKKVTWTLVPELAGRGGAVVTSVRF